MKKIILLSSVLYFGYAAGQDYKTGLHTKGGYTTIYKTTSTPAASIYTNPTSVTRYGLMKDNKIILPLAYKNISWSYEPDLFIVQDTLEKEGLYNGVSRTFISPMDYYDIEIFANGLATVKKKGNLYDFIWGAVDNKGNLVVPLDYDYLGSYQEGLMNFKKDDKFGFIDRNNTVVIPNTYSSASSFGNGLAPVKLAETELYGYIDKQNKMVIPASYTVAETFYKGYATVAKGKDAVALINTAGKELTDFSYSYISMRQPLGLFMAKKGRFYGALDSTGRLVLPVDHTDLTAFDEDYMIFKTTDKKYGLINAKGTRVLMPEYDYISLIRAGRFYTKKNGSFAVLDKNLKQLIPADAAEGVLIGDKHITYFYKDKAKVYDINGKLFKTFQQPNLKYSGSDVIANGDTLRLAYDASISIANLAGNSVKPIPYTNAGDFNEEGIFLAMADGKYNFVDHTGKQLNTTPYHTVVNFSEGICAIQETSSSNPYLADKNFNKIKDLATVFKGPYSEGLALSQPTMGGGLDYLDRSGNKVFTVYAAEGGACVDGRIGVQDIFKTYYYIDKTGKPISLDRWTGLRLYNEGMSAVQRDKKWGFIDGSAKIVIDPQYEEASSFFNGAAIVKKNGKYMLINKEGAAIDNNTYEGAGDPGKGGFPVMKGTKVGLIDSKGQTIIAFNYENVFPLSENRTWALKDGKWGMLDNTGKAITGFIYSGGGEFKNGYAWVTMNEKAGMIDKAGKLVLPVEYKSVGSVYKGMVVAMKGAGVVKYSIK